MKRIHLDDVPWLAWSSPSGKFAGEGRQISEALGAVPNATLAQGGHPFDLELGRLAPGKSGCPFHSHSSQWELFLILQGTGSVRYGGAQRAVQAGDAILHPPGEPHQLINTGSDELQYYLVADNPPTDWWHYPDSNKWGTRQPRGFFRRLPVDYWAGEDDDPPQRAEPDPAAPPPAAASAASAEPLTRFVALASIPWEHRASPKGRYGSYCRDISLALGGIRNTGPAHGGHPFDLQIRRVPAGAAICPFHSHAAQWELFVILRGAGLVRSGDRRETLRAGDVVLHPPGTPHQTQAGPDGELECLIIADNPPVDVFHYPDSNKWGMRPPGQWFRMTEVDYFDGEE